MPDLLRDVSLALRRLAWSPIFTTFSIVTLALGIGITTAAYSILYSLLWREPDVADPSGLFTLSRPMAWSDYRDFVDQQTAFGTVAARAVFSTSLSARGNAELVRGEAVSGDYFPILGLAPTVGRLLQPGDDVPGAAPVAVLSAAVWRSQFGADPSVVGAVVRMGGRAFEVVGVGPDRFSGLEVAILRPIGVWIPLQAAREAAEGFGQPFARGFDPGNRDQAWLSLLARLRPGRTHAEADLDVRAIASRLDAVAPLRQPPGVSSVNTRNPVRGWTAQNALDRSGLASAMEAARVMLAVPALVLLVACTNLANLVLSRGLIRRHEHAVRQALGASRWRLIRSPLLENAIVAVVGGAGGTLVAWALLRWTAAEFEGTFSFLTTLRLDPRLEPVVLAAAGVAIVLALAVSGLGPAVRLTSGHLHRHLTVDVAAIGLMRWRGRSNLIALQVAVSVALFLLTALAVRVLPALRDAPGPGRNLHRAALIEVPFRSQQPDAQRAREIVSIVLADADRIPGIEAAAAVSGLRLPQLLQVTTADQPFLPQDRGGRAFVIGGTPDLFDTMDVPLLAGMTFAETDDAGAPVAVINRALAMNLFGGEAQAVGRDLLVGPLRTSGRDDATTVKVVGVVSDSTRDRLGQPDPVIYRPLAHAPDSDVVIVARSTTADPAGVVGALREAVRRADPDLAVRYTGAAEPFFQGEATTVAMASAVVGTLAAIALVLAMAGLYGVLSYVVLHRTREIGVRMALGADAGRIIRLIIWDGTRPVAEGLFIGLGAAAVIRLILQPGLSQAVSAFDPVATAIAVAPLLIAAVLACYIPARRAARVDPNVALKEM